MTTDREKKKHRNGCYRVAIQRAQRAPQVGLNPVFVWLLFIWVFLSAPFGSAVLPSSGPRRENMQASLGDWPITDYERGFQGPFRRRSPTNGNRYRVRPSLQRLMADLRRPAARADAAAVLAQRIPDSAVRAWVVERIDKGEINRLAVWVRPGRSEEAALAAWQDETDAALAEETAPERGSDAAPNRADMLRVAKLLEALAGTETATSDGPKRPSPP